MKFDIHNHFDFYTQKENGEPQFVGKAENVVLDGLFQWLGTTAKSNTVFQEVVFGKGVYSTEPPVTDNVLNSFVGYKNVILRKREINPKGISEVQYSIELLPTEYNGIFISEVGLGQNTGASSAVYRKLFTKAGIKDNNGNYITIEKKSDEKLIIYATVYIEVVYGGSIFENPLQIQLPVWVQQRVTTTNRKHFSVLLQLCHAVGESGGSIATRIDWAETYRKISGLPYMHMQSWNYMSIPYTTMHTDVSIVPNTVTNDINCKYLLNTDMYNGVDMYGITLTHVGTVVGGHRFAKVHPSAVVIGAGDGVQTKFPVTHKNIKNLQTYVNGSIVPSHVEYSERECHSPLFWAADLSNLLPQLVLGAPTPQYYSFMECVIPYKGGIVYPGWFNGGDVNNQPANVVVEKLDTGWNCRILEPDEFISPAPWTCYMIPFAANTLVACLKCSYTGSFQNATRIYEYDASTGVFGAEVFKDDANTIWPHISGKYGILRELVVDSRQYHNLTTVKFTRTSEALTIQKYGTSYAAEGSDYMAPSISSMGHPAIEDYIHVKNNNSNRNDSRSPVGVYKLDWEAGTFTKLSAVGGIRGTKHAVKVLSGVANGTIGIGTAQIDNAVVWDQELSIIGTGAFTDIVDVSENSAGDLLSIVLNTNEPEVTRRLLKLAKNKAGYWYQVDKRTLPRISYYDQGQRSFNMHDVQLDDEITLNHCIMCRYNNSRDCTESYASVLWPHASVPSNGTIIFETPPPPGTNITAEYDLDYMPKDANWTIDVDITIGQERNTQ